MAAAMRVRLPRRAPVFIPFKSSASEPSALLRSSSTAIASKLTSSERSLASLILAWRTWRSWRGEMSGAGGGVSSCSPTVHPKGEPGEAGGRSGHCGEAEGHEVGQRLDGPLLPDAPGDDLLADGRVEHGVLLLSLADDLGWHHLVSISHGQDELGDVLPAHDDPHRLVGHQGGLLFGARAPGAEDHPARGDDVERHPGRRVGQRADFSSVEGDTQHGSPCFKSCHASRPETRLTVRSGRSEAETLYQPTTSAASEG